MHIVLVHSEIVTPFNIPTIVGPFDSEADAIDYGIKNPNYITTVLPVNHV